MRFLSIFIMVFLLSSGLKAQVVLNEVLFTTPPRVELKNLGATSQDVSSYMLCSFPTYTNIGSMTVLSGDLIMPAGSILVVEGHTFNTADDELGLYLTPPYNLPENIIDYVEWGSSGHARSGTAASAGIWSTGDFVDGVGGAASLEYDGTGEMSLDWAVSATNTQGAENSNVPTGCDASGFAVGNQTICPGESATFQVVLTGQAPWTITYSFNGSMQEPINTSDSPFAWSLSDPGVYNLLTVSDANCEGTAMGTVQVNIHDVPDAELLGPEMICATDTAPALTVALSGLGPWDVSYNLDGAPQGVITFDSSPGLLPVTVNGLYNLTAVSDANCDGTASGSVDFSFIETDGGDLNQNGTANPIYTCIDDGMNDIFQFDVTNNEGETSQLIVTDENGEILSLPSDNTIDFEGSPAGICNVWHISYAAGLTGLDVGNTVPDDLEGCYAISNAIEVIREAGVDCTTGLWEASSARLGVFPNPTSGRLFIDMQGNHEWYMIQVLDLQGRMVMNEQVRHDANLSIDVSALDHGLYEVRILSEEKDVYTARFMKQ